MSICNRFMKQKSDKYIINSKNKIYFQDSILNVICKCAFPKKVEKSDKQICLDYVSVLYSVDVNAHFCFEQKRLSSVSYVTEELSAGALNSFLSEFENDIDKIMPVSIYYESNGKKYWELSDGYASECICIYCKNNKCHINIDFFID